MHTGRRSFLGGVLAAGAMPACTWADAGGPAYLAAAARPDGTYVLCGLDPAMQTVFCRALPARGHAAAAHPARPQAVAFARRPGTFALVLDCRTGQISATLAAPASRHFYGHGTYSASGERLFTTENDYDAERGVIGVWDVAAGYRRMGEFGSGGTGRHDIKRLPGSDILVVANGGIDTHPATGRLKLNIPTMQPNLTYIENGSVIGSAALPAPQYKNSIRHLVVGPRGDVAFGMQWQGEGIPQALVGRHKRGGMLQLFDTPADLRRSVQGYIGSIVYAQDGKSVAVTSPRGGVVHVYDAAKGTLVRRISLPDVCGIAAQGQDFAVTSGTGDLGSLTAGGRGLHSAAPLMWDNHLVAL
jgi:hypothetical protein